MAPIQGKAIISMGYTMKIISARVLVALILVIYFLVFGFGPSEMQWTDPAFCRFDSRKTPKRLDALSDQGPLETSGW